MLEKDSNSIVRVFHLFGQYIIQEEFPMNHIDRKIDSLDFTNDLIFKAVLSSDIELCKELIARIDPETDTEDIRYVETEHEIIVGVKDEKRVRFDVMTRTDRTATDLEMFRYKPSGSPELFSRTPRYNAAMIDAQLTKNHLPKDMPDVSVILFCTYDPLGLGEPVYRISSKVDGFPDYDYNEGRRIIILTDTGIEKAPDQLKPIIYLLSRQTEPIDDKFYGKIQAAVSEVKTDPDVRRAAMILAEKYEAIREESMQIGREEAIKEDIVKMIRIFRKENLPEDRILANLLAEYPDRKEFIMEAMKL